MKNEISDWKVKRVELQKEVIQIEKALLKTKFKAVCNNCNGDNVYVDVDTCMEEYTEYTVVKMICDGCKSSVELFNDKDRGL